MYFNFISGYQCGDYAMDLYVADPSNPARLHLNISLPGEVTTDDDPECRIYWGDGAFDSRFRIKDNQSEISHQYSAVSNVVRILSFDIIIKNTYFNIFNA
jgi:hypothetical protein